MFLGTSWKGILKISKHQKYMNSSKSSVTFEDANVIQQVKNELQTEYIM